MTNDDLVAIQVRLNTALLALSSAIGEAEKTQRPDTDLMATLRTALGQTEQARHVCGLLMEPMP